MNAAPSRRQRAREASRALPKPERKDVEFTAEQLRQLHALLASDGSRPLVVRVPAIPKEAR